MKSTTEKSQSERFQVEKDRGDALLADGDLEGAIDAYQAAINCRPQFWGAYYYKGDALLKQQRYHDAAVAFWSASLYSAGRPEPKLMAARCLWAAQFFRDACRAFETVELSLFDPESALQFAICLAKTDRPKEALALKEKFALSSNKTAVQFLLVDIYIKLCLFSEAEEILYQNIVKSRFDHLSISELARISFVKGDIEASERLNKDCIKLFISEVEKNGKISNHINSEKFMVVAEAKVVLKEICSILERNKINYFLDAGTLLGVVRDGDLLPYDKDMDIGVLGDTNSEVIYQIFSDYPHYSVQKAESKLDRQKAALNIVIVHKALEISTDIFFYHQVDGYLQYGFYNPKFPVLWRHSQFKVAGLVYDGFKYRVPYPTETFLEEMYGASWRTQDPFFESAISSPCLHDCSAPISKAFILMKVYKSLADGNFVKAHEKLKQISKHHLDDEDLNGFIQSLEPCVKTQQISDGRIEL